MSRESELFQHIRARNYTAALKLAQQTPDLDVNALDKDHCSFLMAAIQTSHQGEGQPRYDLIEFLLKHPQFAHANTPLKGRVTVPFQCALTENDPKLIEVLLAHQKTKPMEVLYRHKKLLYAEQAQRITDTLETLQVRDNPILAMNLPKKEQILALLLHNTVHIALERDDTTLLQGLVDAGAKLYQPLQDGTYPLDLARNQPNSHAFRWLTQYINDYILSHSVTLMAAKNLALTHQAREQDLITKFTDTTRSRIQATFKFFDYPPSSTGGSTIPVPQAGFKPGNL
ncbi:MAG: hypothetical protein J0I93_11325 [Legionella sp.]|nr:hypothetical protein [Legionella sp.]